MEPTNNNYDNTQVPPRAPLTTSPVDAPKESNALTIFFVAVFILLSLGAVAFLYYQNQQLKGMLANYQTSIPSPTPIATQDPATSRTAFSSSKFNFTFLYPKEWKLEETKNLIKIYPTDYGNNFYFSIENTTLDMDSILNTEANKLGYRPIVSDLSSKYNGIKVSSIWVENNKVDSKTGGAVQEQYGYYFIEGKPNILIKHNANDFANLIGPILSTFKFTDEKPVPQQISQLFSKINSKFGTDIKPIHESEFYSPSGPIKKDSWKIDLLNTSASGKEFETLINSLLTLNGNESAGIGGGGIDAYEDGTIKCFHSFMGQGPDIHNYLSCALK